MYGSIFPWKLRSCIYCKSYSLLVLTLTCFWSKPSSTKNYQSVNSPLLVFRCRCLFFQSFQTLWTGFTGHQIHLYALPASSSPQAAGWESGLSPSLVSVICFNSVFPPCFMYLLKWTDSNKFKFFRWKKTWSEIHTLKGQSNYHHYIPLLPT